MTTLYKLGRHVFSLDHVESIDLEYDPKRYDKARPPSASPGVELVLSSGRCLGRFWDAEAAVLRGYLTGGDVNVRPIRQKSGLTVLELVPAPEPETDPIDDVAPTWNGQPLGPDEMATMLDQLPYWVEGP